MRFCTRCGCYLSDYDEFCPECGADLRPKIIIASEPYRYRYPVFLLTTIVFAVFAFWAFFALDVFVLFFFIPFVFFRGDRSGPFRYIAMGVTAGMGVGLIAVWIYKYSGLF